VGVYAVLDFFIFSPQIGPLAKFWWFPQKPYTILKFYTSQV